MSRSKKKTKIHGITTAKSEKENKRDANRKLRRIVKQKVNSGKTELPELPELREVSNVWSFDKDGKRYNPEMTEKELRKQKLYANKGYNSASVMNKEKEILTLTSLRQAGTADFRMDTATRTYTEMEATDSDAYIHSLIQLMESSENEDSDEDIK